MYALYSSHTGDKPLAVEGSDGLKDPVYVRARTYFPLLADSVITAQPYVRAPPGIISSTPALCYSIFTHITNITGPVPKVISQHKGHIPVHFSASFSFPSTLISAMESKMEED